MTPRLAALVHPHWRDEIVGDLVEEHHARIRGGSSRVSSSLRLSAGLARAGVTSRWHAWRSFNGPPTGALQGGGRGVMGTLIQDVRFAIRSLRRSPLFTAVALVTLGAGTGLTLAILAVVNGVLLRPLDYPEPDRLVLLQGQPGARYGVSMPAHVLFRDGSRLLDGASAWTGWVPVLEGADGSPSRLTGASVSADFFSVIGISPAAGRLFEAGDGTPGHEPVVVLGHDLWTARFGADRALIGTLLELDEGPHRIVGVAPPGFQDPVSRGLGFSDRQLWRAEPPVFRDAESDPGWVGFWSFGRMSPGASAAGLTEELRALIRAQFAEFDQVDRYASEFRAITVKDAVVEDIRPTLLILLAAVVAVLLIACANLANLLLSRATVRSGELSVRTSLGAGRGRLVRQLLTESAVLSLAGSLLGMALAWLGIRVLVALAGPSLPRASDVAIDGRVFLFALAMAAGTAVLFGIAPALRASAGGVAQASGGSGRSHLASRRSGRLRSSLVVVETALAMVLLSGAGLLVSTVMRLQTVELGFDPEPVLTVQVGLGEERFTEPLLQAEALRRAEDGIAALPGVDAVGSISDLPLSGAVNSTRIRRAEEGDEEASSRSNVLVRAVTPGYFDAMEVPLIRGQPLTQGDVAGSEEVAAVNQEFVRHFYPDEDPLGRLVVVRGVERRIVGVVDDVTEFDLTSGDPDPVLYTPYAQEREGWMRRSMSIVARAGDDPASSIGAARAAVTSADPQVLVGAVRPLATLVEAQVRAPRFRATLILVFAGLAVLLAAIGLGGVVAYAVSQRIPEIGLRLALGAEAGQVLLMMLRQTAYLTVGGVVIGLVGALVSGRVLSGFLFEVAPRDPMVLSGAAVILLGVGLVAGWIPARNAARVQPLHALRGE